MNKVLIIQIIVYALMLGIVISLGSGLYFILRHKGKPEQAVKALTMRIGLSFFLFILLFVGFALGLWHPHHLVPTKEEMRQEAPSP
jgi:hypothetical protein